MSRREAIRGEVGRALDALFTGEQRVYLRDLSGANWKSESTALDKRPVLEDARAWVDALRVTTARDVAAAVRDALRDPAIEEVYVLVCGLPRRSPGAKVPDELAEDLALELDLRQVQVHVVLPLGTKQPDTAEYRDFLASLDAVYRPLADASGGSVSLRHAIEGVPAK